DVDVVSVLIDVVCVSVVDVCCLTLNELTQSTRFSRKRIKWLAGLYVKTSVPTSVADEAVNEEMDDSLERAVTTTTSIDSEQDRGNISKTQSKATPNEPGSQRTSSGVNTPRSGEDSLKLTELMELCNKLQQRVLNLETIKTTQTLEIDSLKRRVKKLEKRKRSRTHMLKRLYKVGLSARVKSSENEGLGKDDASK
nr:hypothetical protein [Tanacetum cinerariifolium]